MITFIENKKDKIFLRQEIKNDSTTAILLIHGLAEHSGRYDDFIKDLTNANISVFAMDLRGHGQTQSKRGDCKNIQQVLTDVELVVNYIKTNHNFKTFGIFGHSMGGLVTSLFASLSNQKLDFLVLSSPAIYLPEKLKIFKFLPYKICPFVKFTKRHSESEAMLKVSQNDPFALQKYSMRMIGVYFVDGVNLLNKKLNITCPVLLVCGKKDRLLYEQHFFDRFFEKLSNPNKKYISYPDGNHRIVQNEGSEDRIKDIINWLKQF